MTELTEVIASNIRKYRKLNKLTQEQMAEKLNLDGQYYAKLETSRDGRAFSVEKIVMASQILGVGIEDIITIESEPATEISNSQKNEIIDKIDHLSPTQVMVLNSFIDSVLIHVK